MTLQLQKFNVRHVALGNQTTWQDGSLTVCAEDLKRELTASDRRICDAEIDVAQPGDETRIVCVKDVVEPRCRISGETPDDGVIQVFAGAAIATCGPIVGFQEGIINMSGIGADYTPFSAKQLITISLTVPPECEPHQHEETVRLAGLRAAEFLARVPTGTNPDETVDVAWDPQGVDEDLHRVAYVYMLLSQGLLHDTYVLGRDAKEGLPQIIDPRTGMTGGIVSGNCVSACDKNTTYFHQNNPVIDRLLQGHGDRWNFVGVVISNELTRLEQKKQSAAAAVKMVKQLNANGVIISKEGFGNPDADLMMIARNLEQSGIRTTLITDEFAGTDGGSQSLADTTPEADAVTSVGNANQQVVLPAMHRVIGQLPEISRLAGGYPNSLREDGSLEVELQAIIGATNQLGYGRLSCREV